MFQEAGTSPWALPLDHADVTAERFGTKAAVLSRLAQTRTAPVPEGWCLSLHEHTAEDIQTHGDLDQIWAKIGNNGRLLVVRSSASVEDAPTTLFAGRFASQPDVSSRTGLLDAVKQVEESVHGVGVTDYLDAFGLSNENIRMSVLIQRQIESRFSGVTFTRSPEGFAEYNMLVEIIPGPSAPLLVGEELGATYGLSRVSDEGGESVLHDHLAGPIYDQQMITTLLPMVFETCHRVERALGAPQDIEWAWDGEDLWVLQARELAPGTPDVAIGFPLGTSISNPEPPVLKKLPRSREWGMKGAAEAYFTRIGRGAARCELILPGESMEKVQRILDKREPGPDGTVIRFSHRAQVGLPKRFVPPGDDIFAAFKSARGEHEDWMGIVSDYVFIESSFEAYITPATLLVEHVPGNWEPDNKLPPDLFKFTEHGTEIFRYTGFRRAKEEAPNVGALPHAIMRRMAPLSAERAEKWAMRFLEDFRIIRRDFQQDLPINVHFISDRSDEFYFLNIRPTGTLEVVNFGRVEAGETYKENRYFTVNTPDDVAGWDGVSNVLVDSVADRGHETRIASVAAALKRGGIDTVFCTFGLLSHPAIVLREFGLRVVPLYIEHDTQRLDARW